MDSERRKLAARPQAMVAAATSFSASQRLYLEPDGSCYCFTVESGVPLFTVCLQSSLALNLLDGGNNVAVASLGKPDPENDNLTLATYR